MKYETLNVILCSPATKKHCNLIGKENMIDPKLFERLGPYESLFLNKENKSMKKNFDEPISWTYINMLSYCVKNKQTKCDERFGYKKAKNGMLMHLSTYSSCVTAKTKFVKSQDGVAHMILGNSLWKQV